MNKQKEKDVESEEKNINTEDSSLENQEKDINIEENNLDNEEKDIKNDENIHENQINDIKLVDESKSESETSDNQIIKIDSDKPKNKKFIVLIICITLLLFLCVFSVIFALLNMNNSKIMSNITINGVDVSGMSKNEAIDTLTKLVDTKKQQTLDLSFDSIKSTISANQKTESAEDSDSTEIENLTDTNTPLSFDTLELSYNITKAVDDAYALGRYDNLLKNNFSILQLLLKGNNVDLQFTINNDVLNSFLDNISANLPDKVIQSSYYIEDNNLIITSGSSGNAVDKQAFNNQLNSLIYHISSTNKNLIELPIIYTEPDNIDLDKIHSEIYKEAQNAYYEQEPFKVYTEIKGIDFDITTANELLKEKKSEYTIPLIITNPEITIKDLNINVFPDLLASFTTKYDASNISRSTNLKLAANKINGTILSPGETFSYNKVVGERTIAAGYKEAKIYSGGEVVDGLGGGICQISSTLYNAVVFANLDVVERHNHQFITSYIGAGRDATVVYGAKDFKFKNSRNYPIKISMSVSGGVASASVYGIKEDVEYEISFSIDTISTLTPSVKYEQDSSIPAGTEKVKQKGSNGVIVKDYKVVKLNGAVISRNFIAQDTYNSMPKIIIQGTGAAPSSSTVTPETPPTTQPSTPVVTPKPTTTPANNTTNATTSDDTNNTTTSSASNSSSPNNISSTPAVNAGNSTPNNNTSV